MANINTLFAVFCFSTVIIFAKTSTTGRTTCRGKTTCRGIRDCAPVMSLIKSLHKPLKPSVVQFLRAQQCGFRDGYPLICCGVLPRTLNIFNRGVKIAKMPQVPKLPKHQRQQASQKKQLNANFNRMPLQLANTESSIESSINKLSVSILRPEGYNIMEPPHFDVTVVTAPPGASTVPYLRFLQKDKKRNNNDGFLNMGEPFKGAISGYMAHYDLQRTRRSEAINGDSDVNDSELDIEVR